MRRMALYIWERNMLSKSLLVFQRAAARVEVLPPDLPMPAAVKDLVRKSWNKVVGPDGKPVYR